MRCRWVLLFVAAAACGLPRDPEGTLESVRGGSLRAAVLGDGGPRAQEERARVQALAASLEAEVVWVEGSVDDLMAQLDEFELDVVIGSVEEASGLAAEAGVTRPYAEATVTRGGESTPVAYVFLVPPGENAWLAEVDRALRSDE